MAYLDAAGRGIRGDARLWMDGGQWKVQRWIRFEDGRDVVDYRPAHRHCVAAACAVLISKRWR